MVSLSTYNQALLDANQSTEQMIADTKAYSKTEGIQEGKASVISDPASYSLVSLSTYNQALLDANQSAEQMIADAKAYSKTEGIQRGKPR